MERLYDALMDRRLSVVDLRVFYLLLTGIESKREISKKMKITRERVNIAINKLKKFNYL